MIGSSSADVDSLFKKVEGLVKGVNATEIVSQKLGKKSLAYPIKRQTEAEYFLFNFEVEGEAVTSISESLRLEQEDVLRYVILKTKVKPADAKGAKLAVVSGGEAIEPPKKTEKVKVEVKAKEVKVLQVPQVLKVKETSTNSSVKTVKGKSK